MDTKPIRQDLLSKLPDVILFLILSRLPTKWVIVLSSVSKQWQQISLNFLENADNYDFGIDFFMKQSLKQAGNTITRILDMNRSNTVIHTFKLLFHPATKELSLTAMNWIRFVTSRGVNEIAITYGSHIDQTTVTLMSIGFSTMIEFIKDNYQEFHLHDFLSNCVSLVTLKLGTCILRMPASYSGFSRLSTLSLSKVLLDDQMFENLVSKCELLQVLILKECEGLTRVRIHSLYLKTVTVFECTKATVFDISGANITSLLISSRDFISSELNRFDNLKIVTVLNFQGSPSDINMVSYFLKHAPALKSMLLVTPQGDNDTVGLDELSNNALSHIHSSFPWASSTAEVKLIQDINEDGNLLSIVKFHQAFDVFYSELPKPARERSGEMYEYYG